MKNKKGFTLIELLAIIVILAIIAVITVPIILNIIENSKMGAVTDSAYGFKDAVNKSYLTKLLGDSNYVIPDNTYTVEDLKTQIDLSLSGKEPASNSWVTIQENDVTEGCLQYDEFKVEFTDGKVSNTEKGECRQIVIRQLAIGDTINYSTSMNGVTLNDWKVFYIDGDYTYLIMTGYLPITAIDITDIIEDEPYYISTNNGSRELLLSVMTTKSNWDSLLKGTLNGTITVNETTSENIWAMGSPDIELWVNSWNESYPADKLYLRTITSQDYDNNWFWTDGYAIDDKTPVERGQISLTQKIGYGNTLYFPGDAYWLASPGTGYGIPVLNVYSGIGGSDVWYSKALRPVIKFPTSIINQ